MAVTMPVYSYTENHIGNLEVDFHGCVMKLYVN
jgi:hypothetical protein